jgi:hypothetical protein
LGKNFITGRTDVARSAGLPLAKGRCGGVRSGDVGDVQKTRQLNTELLVTIHEHAEQKADPRCSEEGYSYSVRGEDPKKEKAGDPGVTCLVQR